MLLVVAGCGAAGPRDGVPVAPLPAAAIPALPPGAGVVRAEIDHRIWVVFQSSDGARWFGSDGAGVFRFDGETIVQFTREHGLDTDGVRSIQEDSKGGLFVACHSGAIRRFDGRAFTAVPPADPAQSSWRLDPDDLWFAGPQDSGLVYRWDGGVLHTLSFPATPEGDAFQRTYPRSQYPAMRYNPYDVYRIFRDSRGHVWFGTGTLGVCRYDGTSFAWARKGELGMAEVDSFGVRSISEDRDGNLWFCDTRRRFQPRRSAAADGSGSPGASGPFEGSSRGVFTAEGPVEGVLSAVRDRNGDLLWATYGDGVWRFDGRGLTHHPVTLDGAPIHVFTIYRDRQDDLWLGTQQHGAFRFVGGRFEPFRPRGGGR